MTKDDFRKQAWTILPSNSETDVDLIYKLVDKYDKLGIEKWSEDVVKTFLCGFMVGCSAFSDLIREKLDK